MSEKTVGEKLDALGGKHTPTLDLFEAFCDNLHDVDEEEPELPTVPGGSLDNDTWQNRLGWAWWRLHKFAEALGPEYVKALQAYYTVTDDEEDDPEGDDEK